jgi:hypothetical protein
MLGRERESGRLCLYVLPLFVLPWPRFCAVGGGGGRLLHSLTIGVSADDHAQREESTAGGAYLAQGQRL